MTVLRLPGCFEYEKSSKIHGMNFEDFFYKEEEKSKMPVCRFLFRYCEKNEKILGKSRKTLVKRWDLW